MTSTNDGKDVKINQTSGPKGKSYYIELYKFLEARLTDGGDARERTKHLCVAWRSVHRLCQHSAPSTHTHLLNWLQRHTARAVLQTEWQKPERKDDRKSLEEAIDTFVGHVAETPRDGDPLLWEAQLVARGEWFKRVLDKPWDHPVLTLLLNPNGTPPTDDEVLAWLKEERGVTFVVRLHALVGEKCDDIAVSLASAVMERARASLPPVPDSEERTEAPPVENAPPTFADKLKEEAGFTPDVWETLTDIEFVLLHKRDSNRCITLAKQTPLLDAYPLIERLQKRLEVAPRDKRLWKNAKEVAILIAQVVIARCMVVKSCGGAARTALYCCARILARLLASRLPAAADALAAQAPTARHLHTLAQAVDKQLSHTHEEMKPYVCELYVRAITAGMNELERLKLKTEKEAEALSMEKTLASWFVQLGTVLSRSERIACECALTAFSLHPSQKMYERIDAAPPLQPVITDANESKEEIVKSEFGSWANDSRSQTNLVKTSETLNMKHTHNQANVLSTAMFNEGEALGLSPELCQDIAVLLAGPRVKTLSWDMDRKLLLDNCRAYSEVTHEGTRVLTRELKYLNLDLQQYQHLPEEKDDDENDPYYGIERGYEHLAVLEEPEEIWGDAKYAETTETASSIEEDPLVSRRKKKTKLLPPSSDEDSDPLSFVAEAKRTQKKKERPLSKERSKVKKKQDLIDPLDINVPSQDQADKSQTKPKKEAKEKKERKKKEKVLKVISGKRSALANLLSLRMGKSKKKPKEMTAVTTPVTDSYYDSQGKNSMGSLNSEGTDAIEESISGADSKNYATMTKNARTMYSTMGHKSASLHAFEGSPSNLTRMQYRPQTPNAARQQTLSNLNKTTPKKYMNYPEDVRANLSKLLEFRRQTIIQKKLALQNSVPYTPPRQPAIIKPDIPLTSNISPKSVIIPEIPKSYISKEQLEKAYMKKQQEIETVAELIRAKAKAEPKDSVIQYARITNVNKTTTASKKTGANKASSSLDARITAQQMNAMKMTDFVNPSYDRLMAEIAERHSRGPEISKPAQSQYQPVHSRSYNVPTPGQRDFQNFIKDYDQGKYMPTPHAIDMSSKSTREVKKPIMPVSRVIPIVPNLPKPDAKVQCPKQPALKKPEPSLNTFSRLSYHKNKQNEMKNRIQSPKPACKTSTYQEISSELDEIIKEHQRAQMKVIQSKRENVEKFIKPVNCPETVNKTKHPLLSNLLHQPSSPQNVSCRNESQFKNNPLQQESFAPQRTSLSEKDNNDLLNLLRQQDKLNNYMQYSTNISSKKSTSAASKAQSGSDYSSKTCQFQQQLSKPLSQDSKPVPSLLETKIINVISNTLLKPGLHEINKSLTITKTSSDTSMTKPVNFTQKTAKKNVTGKDTMEKKHIPESSKPEWQAVMCDLLRHKTPTRVQKEFDVAPNKTPFELAYERSLKGASVSSQPAMGKDMVPKKHYEKANRAKPVITSIKNVIITKKGIKVQNEVLKLQKDTSANLKTHSANERSKEHKTPETTKKLPQEVQRKHFTYSGPNNIDPFISGIPNSDYDLLEELMDDELRKEIGELSSDDESYNVMAQSFLKPTSEKVGSEKRVSVQFNKSLSEPAKKSPTNVRCLNDRQCTNEILRSATPKPQMSQCANKMAQAVHESHSPKIQQRAENRNLDSSCLMPSTSQSAPTRYSNTSNARNQAYNNVETLTKNQVMVEPKFFISAVPQPAPMQNVVVLGQEVVYGGYTSVPTPVRSVHNLTPNPYVTVNSAPAMTLYQTTQYTAPVVIGTSITVPVLNSVPCSGTSVQHNMNNTVAQSCYPAVTVEPQPSLENFQLNTSTSDIQSEMKNKVRVADYSQPNYMLQEEIKASERKVLSEVQDFTLIENIDKSRNHKIDNSIIVNMKKDTVIDTERLKKKRLAIINREICHRCGEDTIPLKYSPLPMKIETVIEIHEFSKASDDSSSSKEDKQKLSDGEEEKLLAQTINNLKDLSDAINEVQSPATPDSNDSKENKSYTAVQCRRILLRSSNKITPKPNAEKVVSEKSTLKKSKVKLKSEVYEAATVVSEKVKQDKIEKKEGPKRASKRLHNKKIKNITEEKKPLRQRLQKPYTKIKPSSSNKIISKLSKITNTESIEYKDIESELKGSKITKKPKEHKNKSEDDNIKAIDFEVDTAIHENRANEQVIPEASPPQKSGLSEHTSIDDRHIPATDEDIKIDVKGMLGDIGNKIEQNATAMNPAIERKSDEVSNDINKKTDDTFGKTDDRQDVNDICVNVSRSPRNELEKKITTTNNHITKHKAKDSTEQLVPCASVIAKDLLITNSEVKEPSEKCDVSDNAIYDQNKSDLPENDNIDLDMCVTCEEVPKPKLSPTFGTIKAARSKPINANKTCDVKVDIGMTAVDEGVPKLIPKFDNIQIAKSKTIHNDKKEDVKICPNVKINDGIPVNDKNTKDVEKLVAVAHGIEVAKKIKPYTETVNVEQTLKSRLRIKTNPKSNNEPEPAVLRVTHSEKPNTTDTSANVHDDVIIIDDDSKVEPLVCLEPKIEASVKNPVSNEASVINSTTNCASDETISTHEVTRTPEKEASLSNVTTQSKIQTPTKQAVKHNPSNIRDLSEMPRNIIDNINIEHLPPIDPMTNRVRVSLPNGKKVIVTVGKGVCVTLDSLFTFPSIKEALMSEMNHKKRYIMYIQQTTTIDNSDPNKILSVQLNNIEDPALIPVIHKPVETIDLLSDEEENNKETPQVTDTKKQVFITEYGNFTTSSMDKDLFMKHQDKFSKKPRILLKKVNATSGPPRKIAQSNTVPLVANQYVTKLKNDFKNILASTSQQSVISKVESKPVSSKEIAPSDMTPLIPKQYVTGLMNDIENKLAFEINSKPPKIPEIVEIDDSSNDSSYQDKSAETKTEYKAINELKNELLKELGVQVQTKTLPATRLQDELSNDDDVEIVKERTLPKNNKRRKVLKLSVIPTGESCPFDDLDEEIQLQLTKRKCAVKLVRCDDLAKKFEENVADALNQSVQLNGEITIPEKYPIFNILDQKILEAEERSSSPVIELSDVLVSLNNQTQTNGTPAVSQLSLPCKANWHNTKSMLHSRSVHDAAFVRCTIFESVTSDDSYIDQAIPRPCGPNWLTAKFSPHLQGIDDEASVRSSGEDILDESMIEEVTPLSCEAYWLTTKFMIHLQSDKDVALIRSFVSDYDAEMCDDNSINKVIPLACKSNWLTTKPMLHLQCVNNRSLERSHAFENDRNYCDDSLPKFDQATTLSCESDWLMTKFLLYIQGVTENALTRSNISEYDDEMCDDVYPDQTIPLSCEANWHETKSALRWQSAAYDKPLEPSSMDCDDERCNNYLNDKSMPLSCEANWLSTKSALYIQTLKKLTLLNVTDFDSKMCNLAQNMTPLTCEARWLTTKTTLHLEAARNIFLLPSDVLADKNENCCGRTSPISVVKIPETISLEGVLPSTAPSLALLVLECFRNSNCIQQHILLRNASTHPRINVLKRKSLQWQSSAACKVSKLNKISETKLCIYSPADAINTSASELGNVSSTVLQDTKMVPHLKKSSVNKTLESSLCGTTCDDNHNLNIRIDAKDHISENSTCGKIEATVINSKVIIGYENENHTLSASSDITSEENIFRPGEYRSTHEIDYLQANDRDIKGVISNATESDAHFIIVNENHALFSTPDIANNQIDEDIEDLRECRTPSPVIDITNIIFPEIDTMLQLKKHNGYNSQTLSSNITIKQLPQISTENNSCNSIGEQSFGTENILDKPEDIHHFDSNSTICLSPEAKNSGNVYLEKSGLGNEPYTNEQNEMKPDNISNFDDNSTTCMSTEVSKLANVYLEKSALGNEPYINEKSVSGYCDDIESKLAEIVGEPLIESNSAKESHCDNIIKMPDSENSEIIRIILRDEPFRNTDRKDIELTVAHEEKNVSLKNSDTPEHLKAGDHMFYTSLGDPIGSIDETSQDEKELSYEDVMVLSENESTIELEEEVVDMHSDEIVDDFFFEATTTADVISGVKIQRAHFPDQVSGSVNLADNIFTATTKDGDQMEEMTTQLMNDLSTESIMSKYRALIRNKSQVLESIVEYEDPETGTCFIIPIVEESHNDITSIENDEDVTPMQNPRINEKKANTKRKVNVGTSSQNNTSRLKEVYKDSGLNYDDIEVRLAEIVGESLAENDKTHEHKTRFVEKYKTYNPKKEVDDFTRQLRKTSDQNTLKSLSRKTNSDASKKRQWKCYVNPEDVSKVTGEDLKVLYATKCDDQITNRKSLKRKIDTSKTETSERKDRKDNHVFFVENKATSTHDSYVNEKYKFSYNVEVKAMSRLERNAEDVTCQRREAIDHASYKNTAKSSGINIPGASKKWGLKFNDKSGHNNNAFDTENLKVKLPKVTYSKITELMMTRQRSLKRKIDAPDSKTSERKYRKGKNIDYPKFTVAALSETAYTKEYKSLIDYCSSVKFSFSVPFHREHIDVHDKHKSWPIENSLLQSIEQSVESNERLFAEIEKSDAPLDPLEQTLPEELSSKFDENSYTPSNIHETNFNMGFGERSGRVIQESKDGEFTTFSAATLSDVKQLQPLLPSDEKVNIAVTNCVDNKINDQKLKTMRFIDHLNLRDKVRSFFEKTKAELSLDWKVNSKKVDFEYYNETSSWPFGDLTSTRCIRPCPVEITINVVQVGQLPVSAAAQNPVTCDPRVTHVSNASPSQCSPGSNLGDELQTPIKTEYTELTTADITLPLMQDYVQHHSMPTDSQQSANAYSANDSTSMTTQIKSIVKIELMEETSQENEEDNVDYENNGQPQQNGKNINNSVQYQFENLPSHLATEPDPIVTANYSKASKTTISFLDHKNSNNIVEKPDQLAHAMNAAGISATKGIVKLTNSVDAIPQTAQSSLVTASQATTNNFSKGTSINAIALQQALAQILPSSLNQTNTSENNLQTSTNPQVLHIVQGNNAQSVINKPNGTQLLHIVQNKTSANTNGTPSSQQNTFNGLSLVDGAIQQGANQLLHIVNTTNQKNTNAGQLLKRVNLLTNLANVQGSNEQKMVQFVCKSADGKSIQLPHQRGMVLRLQPLDPPNVSNTPKQNDNQDHSSSSGTTHLVNKKEPNTQEMKSRSLYEENYAKFVQNDAKFTHNGDSKAGPEKATSLPKFNQVFGKQIYQDKQNEMDSENLPESSEPPEENNPPLEQMNDITNPPMLIRKTNPIQPSHVQPNLVQQIKQSIGPMNIQTMHGGVIYTRQIPVNIGNGQTINLITVPSTELVDDSAQKQQTDGKFGNQEGDPPIIKIVPTNQPSATPNGSTDDNNPPIRSTNESNPQTNPQPQPVLTQMRIKLPMLSKAPQMVGGTRVVRPSFFQIQRNVIGGANQQVYQQLVLTAAPPLGQSIRLPAQVQKPKTPSEAQSSPESQMSSSTLEQLREFDMVLEQVKERSTVQPGSSSANNFTKLKSSPDTTDAPTPSTSNQESPTQVLYSVGSTQPLNIVNYVNRKSTITSTTTPSFVRSPDSTGTVESPSSSTHSHLPHTITSDSCASSSCASEAAAATAVQSKPKKKKPKPSTSSSNPFNIKNTPKPSSQKPLEDEQTTQRILYILAEYKEQVENSPDKDKPAPRRRNNPAAPNAGSSKRKKSSSGSRRRDMSPVLGEDSCRTMGSEDSSCGTSLGECNECLETQSPEESPKKVVRRLTFEQEVTQVTQTRTTTTATTTTTTVPQRNVIVTDGQAFAVRGATGKPATTVLMPANYLLPVSMVKGGQQIAIVTNRGPKLLVGAGEGGTGGTLLFQRLIGPGGLKPVLTRPGVRHIRLPTAALHNLQAFNIATPAAASVQPPDSTASPAPAPTPPDLVDTRAMSSPWPDRDAGEVKPERGNSSPEGSEPWNLPSSSIADDYGYEEIVRTDNMDRTVLDAIPDRYSPDLEAQRIFDKMFDSDSKKSMYDSRCGYDIDASDDDKAYHQVVHRKDGRHTTRLTHVSAAALRHKYAILEHELRLQKSLSEECEDLGVDSPSASELFPEAELLFAPSPAHEQTIDQCHTPQPTIHSQGIPQPDLDDQIATDHLLTHKERHDDLDINLDDVGEIVTVGEDGMTTIPLDHEEFARSHAEFARSHPNTTFHSEPEDGEVPPFTIAQGVKGRQITFHSRGVPGTVVIAPQTTVISQATIEASGTQNPVKFSDIDNMINAMPSSQHGHINMPSVLKDSNESLNKFDRLLNESRDLNLSNTASAIVHSTGNGTQVIRRVQFERRDSRYLVEDDAMIAGDSKTEERRDLMDDTSSSERHPELFWDTQSRPERKRFDFSSDSDKCCKSPYEETNSDSSGVGAHTRLDSVIKAARTERRRSDGSSAEESHPPLRTYPPKRTHHSHHSHHDVDRSVTGKTRASDRCHDNKDESRRRASNRGVVKRGCHCCNGSTPPKPKKSRPRKSNDYPHN